MPRLTLPTLDVNTTHATLTAWHKKPGDTLRAGDIVAELTTDKAAFDLESPFDGTLLKILAPEKSILPSNYILALIGVPGETDPTAEADNAALLESVANADAPIPQSPSPNPIHPSAISHQPSPSSVRATPKARRLAQQHNLNLADIQAQIGAALIDEQVLLPFIK